MSAPLTEKVGAEAGPPAESFALEPVGDVFNTSTLLTNQARLRPDDVAIITPEGRDAHGKREYSKISFADLEAMSARFAHAFARAGLERGDRVVMMVSQGVELIAMMNALFKAGLVPVVIDPGMGRKNFLACVQDASPRGMLGIPRAYLARLLFKQAFRSVEVAITTEAKWWNDAVALSELANGASGEFEALDTAADELAAILFTSGSTGIPKGVHYTHRIFGEQTRAIQKMYGLEPGEVDVPGFALFALFSTGMGMTCVIPDMDPTRPAAVDPRNIVEAVQDNNATTTFGSPAIWHSVASHCEAESVRLPTLRRILMAGAPISPVLMQRYQRILADDVWIHTPYGATESLPVATTSSREVLDETAAATREGKGICVGTPVEGTVEVRIIAIDDGPLPTWEEVEELEPGHIGEICVRGVCVTPRYDNKPDHTARAKIGDPEQGPGEFWHRMGDLGYLDESGRLWFCGRKAHRVETEHGRLYSVSCEALFNEHPDVYRSALVGVGDAGRQTPAIVVEPHPHRFPLTPGARDALVSELREIAASSEMTSKIEVFRVHRAFPVDNRHNAKIHREELAEWVARTLA